MGIGLWILWAILTVALAAVLELGKHTVLGWILAAAVMGGFAWYRHTVLAGAGTGVRIAAWLAVLACAALVLLISRPPVRPVPAVSVKNPEKTEVYQTGKGPVQGVYNADRTVEVFAGIPYAKPPVGELRFRPPVEAEAWSEVRVCDEFAPMSMQRVNSTIYSSLAQIIGYHDYKISLSDNYREPVSEDSLYVNVWKPAGAQEKLPVLVYIHGGSLQTGQPWYQDYSGESFAKDGVVCVNMGYRLGVFGFFAAEELLAQDGTTGNYGLLDQILALQWVQENIEAFGGDPDNVTIIGESAGAVCVDALCVSPLARGLFRRAILESSTVSSAEPPHSYRSFEKAVSSGKDLMERYGCASVDELRALPAEKIVGEMDTQHHITVDGSVLPADPYVLRSQGVHNEEALLHGYNSEESGPFILFGHANAKNYEGKVRAFFGEYADRVLALYPGRTDEEADRNWTDIYSAIYFNYSHYCLNRLALREGIPVWEYYFSKDNGRLGAWHSGEMVYTFGVIPEGSKLYDARDYEVEAEMHRAWVNFAAGGDPNGEGVPAFAQSTGDGVLMEFGESTGPVEEPMLPLYEILDEMQGWQ
ncbi:MAG: carboxylesterase family protein [Lachnospiraceae bacterium]|nr:carboxylesterase family protein [Lachnospiraceae bacterium]